MNRPPVTYRVSLADLVLFSDAAAELDDYKDTLEDNPAERARIIAMVYRIHDTVERVAGNDSTLVYAPSDEAAA